MIKISKTDIGKRVVANIPDPKAGTIEKRHGKFVGFSEDLPLIKYDDFETPRKAFADWLEWETK